jgi:hypothetical protein
MPGRNLLSRQKDKDQKIVLNVLLGMPPAVAKLDEGTTIFRLDLVSLLGGAPRGRLRRASKLAVGQALCRTLTSFRPA